LRGLLPAMSRKRVGPSQFLRSFQGYLQADAFSGYDGIYAGGDVVEVGCNAHARRKFIEAQTTDAARPAAALAYYRQLYTIERDLKAEIGKLPPNADESARAAIRFGGPSRASGSGFSGGMGPSTFPGCQNVGGAFLSSADAANNVETTIETAQDVA